MLSMKKYIYLFFFIGALTLSCKQEDPGPIIPQLQFLSYTSLDSNPNDLYTDSLAINLSFQDGDGDIGFQKDELKDLSDLFVTQYDKVGKVLLVTELEPGYRIPYIEPQGNNKSIKGTITIKILTLLTDTNDTMHFSLFLKDRAFHSSNKVITPNIIINHK